MKRCTRCKTTKSLSEFGKSPHHKGGRRTVCKSCMSEYEKRRAKAKKISAKYKITKEAMNNHFYLHFGFVDQQKSDFTTEEKKYFVMPIKYKE